jgi:hypothetical protein
MVREFYKNVKIARRITLFPDFSTQTTTMWVPVLFVIMFIANFQQRNTARNLLSKFKIPDL